MNKNIVLIGMPASGKSTCGILLAKYLCMDFVDTDIEIQNKFNKSLEEIIKNDGIPVLMKAECEVGIKCAELQNTIISTGGSMVYYESAMEKLKEKSIVVYLEASVEVIGERCSNLESRGIIYPGEMTLVDIYLERLPLYKKYTDITVNVNDLSAIDTVKEIIRKVNI